MHPHRNYKKIKKNKISSQNILIYGFKNYFNLWFKKLFYNFSEFFIIYLKIAINSYYYFYVI
uniref:Uncharacterized protein n=1 Tax=viral metagenome TaxID=1070528 RepID=A0A6C0H8B7_9ZZZZ